VPLRGNIVLVPAVVSLARDKVLLPCLFTAQSLTEYSEIVFLIDTGTATTTISHRDAKRMGIDYSILERSQRPASTFGGHVFPFVLKGTKIVFQDQNGNIIREKLDSVDVLGPSENEELDKILPSALGMDFIRKARYRVIIDLDRREAYLDK